ncbi:Phosphoesterase domain protein [Kalmanozyma brasiliensis GHG001]|uniref:Mre11 DNA-binding domain-containing protein n=2 Tax=Kalmanozyma brasiliensis TaxID=1392244 RepID=V5ETK2_KALBG|nr:Phosphoesterase domain protein [Kalmanozyma brasiliensis GHG001]EST08580.1 Phosphoesterase domain protein [Kalmanozyma brasiliensis GHG001]DBA11306.1 TPA_inf: MRE11 [Kalmanozyma brasiliensis]
MVRLTRRTGTQRSTASQRNSEEHDQLESSTSQHQDHVQTDQPSHTRTHRRTRSGASGQVQELEEASEAEMDVEAEPEADQLADEHDTGTNAQQLPPSTFSAQSEGDHIKIMLATDNHIGYMERDPVRGQDSIRTFEEILQLAVQHEVDFILLGGDLFHENKPSRATLHQTMALLRQYTLGDKPISVELLSDPNDGALPGRDFPAINYEDPNLNVGIPVFSIHGNHDDPQGVGETGALSALDLLSVSGLINYFGKIELPSDDATAGSSAARTARGGAFAEKGIRIKPVLLQKGQTKLALYGMGNIKDERMHFELRTNRVRMYRPSEDPDSWFNILCVHQNRVAHNPKACVPETMFDDSIHLVVWGHEHEQMINPQPVTEKKYHITQPGSSVATSLSQGETVEKCVAIVHVEKTDFLIEPIPLQTVRPFVMDDMVLSEELEEAGLSSERSDIIKLLRKRVEGLIVRAKQEFKKRYPDREMPLPLVRLRVEYTNQEISNPQRFGQEFAGKVANPKEVLQFTKRKSLRSGRRDQADAANGPSAYVDVEEEGLLAVERLEKVDVGKLVQEYLQAQNLDILNPEGLEGAVLNFVEKDDREAIDSFVTKMLKNTVKGLVTIDPEESRIEGELERLRQQQQEQRREMELEMEGAQRNARAARGNESDDSMMDDLEPPRAAAPARGGGRGRNARAAHDHDEEDEEDDFDDGASVASSTRRGATRQGAAAASTSRARKAPAASRTAARTPARATASSSRTPAPTFLGPESAYAEGQDEESDMAIDERPSTPAPAPTRGHASVLDMLSKQNAASKPSKSRSRATAAATPAKSRAAVKPAASRQRQQQQQESIQISDDEEDAIVDDQGEDDDDFVEPASRAGGRRAGRR